MSKLSAFNPDQKVIDYPTLISKAIIIREAGDFVHATFQDHENVFILKGGGGSLAEAFVDGMFLANCARIDNIFIQEANSASLLTLLLLRLYKRDFTSFPFASYYGHNAWASKWQDDEATKLAYLKLFTDRGLNTLSYIMLDLLTNLFKYRDLQDINKGMTLTKGAKREKAYRIDVQLLIHKIDFAISTQPIDQINKDKDVLLRIGQPQLFV